MKRVNKKISQSGRGRSGASSPGPRLSNQNEQSNTVKDPEEWTTGDEEMTGAQRSYLKTLADEAGEEVEQNLSKAEASRKIDELQQKTGRGRDH